MEMDKSIAVTWLEPKIIAEVLNETARICRAEADRWYHSPITGELLFPNHGERFALMHSELSEAFEAVRKDKMDDHLTHRKAVEVELADLLIRVLHFSGDEGLDLGGALVEKLDYNRVRADHTDAARASQHGKRF